MESKQEVDRYYIKDDKTKETISKSVYKRLAIQSEKVELKVNASKSTLNKMDTMCDKLDVDYEELLDFLIVIAESTLPMFKEE